MHLHIFCFFFLLHSSSSLFQLDIGATHFFCCCDWYFWFQIKSVVLRSRGIWEKKLWISYYKSNLKRIILCFILSLSRILTVFLDIQFNILSFNGTAMCPNSIGCDVVFMILKMDEKSPKQIGWYFFNILFDQKRKTIQFWRTTFLCVCCERIEWVKAKECSSGEAPFSIFYEIYFVLSMLTIGSDSLLLMLLSCCACLVLNDVLYIAVFEHECPLTVSQY